jgi:S1-C subfamily serine protease
LRGKDQHSKKIVSSQRSGVDSKLEIMKFKSEFMAMLGLAVSLSCFCSWTAAQTPASTKRPNQGPVVVERQPASPQVITVVHRINGLKLLRLLMRSGEKVGGVETMDEALAMTSQAHTNIIAGLALDDGQTIVAWLPEAEVEIEATLPFAPRAASAARASSPPLAMLPGKLGALPDGFFERPDISIIGRDGKPRQARYIGLDGITGLSLLKLADKDLPSAPNMRDLEVSIGQRLRLFFPEPVRETGASTSNSVYVRIGESEGQIVSVLRGTSGEISRIKIKSLKLTAANVGGVAVNSSGQTVGIVESIEDGEANVLSPAVIRAAARRVLKRQTSVPRPWLGISGEPVAFTSLDQIVRKGWETGPAMSLLQNQRGILLNSVAPGSPAAIAALRAGDVIVRVNDNDVKSTNDFSLMLTEAGTEPVRFTIVRPGLEASESVVVKLSEIPDQLFARRMFEGAAGSSALLRNPLVEQGIETVPLRPLEAPFPGAANGLLVVYVQPASAALKSGLRPLDVIEAIDGQPISVLSSSPNLDLTNVSFTLSISRNKEKLVLTVVPLEK